ncbi:lactate oxidase [Streptococcus pneumoniae]|uniref:lactate oxidase n=1 Tax=Streptococcus pneumoniae TaxID=1313 RepID=UPI000B588AC6
MNAYLLRRAFYAYKTSNAEGHVDFINTYDLEPMAQQVIPKAAFGYIASGAEDTFTSFQ